MNCYKITYACPTVEVFCFKTYLHLNHTVGWLQRYSTPFHYFLGDAVMAQNKAKAIVFAAMNTGL